jgi:hypothetical protein
VIDASFCKFASVVFCLIQAYNVRHSKMFEHFQIVLCGVPVLWLARRLMVSVYRTHKGYKLAWNDPVQVSIFYLFIVFILSRVEILKAVPSELCGNLQALEAMIYL